VRTRAAGRKAGRDRAAGVGFPAQSLKVARVSRPWFAGSVGPWESLFFNFGEGDQIRCGITRKMRVPQTLLDRLLRKRANIHVYTYRR